MITIHEPELIEKKETAIIRARFEYDDKSDYLWFSVLKQYKNFLTYERADAFLIGLLLFAMKKGQDIQLTSPISERLYYTLTHYYIRALHLTFTDFKEISIYHNGLDSTPLHNHGAVGTGFSAGIDSFFTLKEHSNDTCPPAYQITHFTFHNVGSHGDFGGDDSRNLFKNRLSLVKPFAEEIGTDVIMIDSNISEILQFRFVESHTIRNIAAVLSLQKLFRVYYYSSAYQFTYFELNPKLSAAYDLLSLPMLSTETTTFFSSAAAYTRFERTEKLTEYEPSYRYLNVCASGSSTNCSTCPKCMRTLLTFDILGKLHLYKDVFNLKKYKRSKAKFIARVLASKETVLHQELYDKMVERNFNIPIFSRFLVPMYKLKFAIKKD